MQRLLSGAMSLPQVPISMGRPTPGSRCWRRSNSLQTLLELQGQLEGVDPDALEDLVTEALERVFGGGDKIRPAPDPDAPLE